MAKNEQKKPMPYKEIRAIKQRKKNGTFEAIVIFTCPNCGREWFTKGIPADEIFFSQSVVHAPSKCPCHLVRKEQPGENKNSTP